MSQLPSAKGDVQPTSLEVTRRELVRALDAARTELLAHGPSTAGQINRSIIELETINRRLEELIQSLRSAIAALNDNGPSALDSPSVAQDVLPQETNVKWQARYGRYLSDEFRDEVTAHFHEAKRRALEGEPSAHPQAARD